MAKMLSSPPANHKIHLGGGSGHALVAETRVSLREACDVPRSRCWGCSMWGAYSQQRLKILSRRSRGDMAVVKVDGSSLSKGWGNPVAEALDWWSHEDLTMVEMQESSSSSSSNWRILSLRYGHSALSGPGEDVLHQLLKYLLSYLNHWRMGAGDKKPPASAFDI
ncbi:hypothetical protein Salat_2764900 [Sesamum alatum]|uniref:Uncharacterized protein n=1 Tax=Sesamum alatum TaxID=300844 RepID=A0AAE2C931_9LAMI|nr:hypothetical protein Salat_2764900 [Sesamum alatum]